MADHVLSMFWALDSILNTQKRKKIVEWGIGFLLFTFVFHGWTSMTFKFPKLYSKLCT